jgi:hypothetical protein|tara:strand:- start:5982 stop:6083 length:102 start_codon:yes stop_codon:yes gene_type:complete
MLAAAVFQFEHLGYWLGQNFDEGYVVNYRIILK